jgi:hypothetical protein
VLAPVIFREGLGQPHQLSAVATPLQLLANGDTPEYGAFSLDVYAEHSYCL